MHTLKEKISLQIPFINERRKEEESSASFFTLHTETSNCPLNLHQSVVIAEPNNAGRPSIMLRASRYAKDILTISIEFKKNGIHLAIMNLQWGNLQVREEVKDEYGRVVQYKTVQRFGHQLSSTNSHEHVSLSDIPTELSFSQDFTTLYFQQKPVASFTGIKA